MAQLSVWLLYHNLADVSAARLLNALHCAVFVTCVAQGCRWPWACTTTSPTCVLLWPPALPPLLCWHDRHARATAADGAGLLLLQPPPPPPAAPAAGQLHGVSIGRTTLALQAGIVPEVLPELKTQLPIQLTSAALSTLLVLRRARTCGFPDIHV